MSYRSLKEYLGETNLERKCRFLFGVSLVILLGIGLWVVNTIAESHVFQSTNNQGRAFAVNALLNMHWDVFTDPKFKDFRSEIVRDLQTSQFESKIVSNEYQERETDIRKYVSQPESNAESMLVEELKKKWMEQKASLLQKPETPAEFSTQPDPYALTKQAEAPKEILPVFESRVDRERGKYHYYQPVYWKESCLRCHEGMYGKFSESAAESLPLSGISAMPFRVVKVTIPYERTRQDITWTRAILLTVLILIVVLAMGALWVIVRYVIVKPLNHLRDVSDAVAHGFTDQRAEITTGDEFEELASSFNKMLRHLVNTQAEIRNVNKDLDAKVDELAQLNMRLYETNRVKSDFLANMSHELRTPLNSIIGFSEVLQGIESLTEKQRRYAQNIQKSGRLLLDMINDILDLAKLEAGQMELRLTEFQLPLVLHAQCDMVRSLTDEKNIDLVVNLEPNLPALYQDQSKLQQILTNLLSNAIKFTPEGGRITVTAKSHPQGLIELSVSDTGVGIADSDREIIFEKFRQGAIVMGGDNLTREFSGTGLGLSIVRELCKLMGGEVLLESELGKGSTFTIKIPWMALTAVKQNTPFQDKLEELERTSRNEMTIPATNQTETLSNETTF